MVLVLLGPAGIQALEDFRGQFMALLRADLASTTAEQIEALAAAAEALEDSSASCSSHVEPSRRGEGTQRKTP